MEGRTSRYPKGPCRYMVYTWASKGCLYAYFGLFVHTRILPGPVGICAKVAVSTIGGPVFWVPL